MFVCVCIQCSEFPAFLGSNEFIFWSVSNYMYTSVLIHVIPQISHDKIISTFAFRFQELPLYLSKQAYKLEMYTMRIGLHVKLLLP